jgi:HAD superfamily hydrolase (TIGR01509 family)
MTALVVFDCDGVLVQTEPGETRAILTVARRYGFAATLDEGLALFRGRKLAEVATQIEHFLGGPLPDSFVPEVRDECARTVDRSSPPSPGVAAALSAMTLPSCVASSSPMPVIRARLGAAGLLRRFDSRVFSAYDVGSWKPDPGLFLHAAAACGEDPAQCVVVEDSLVGVQAALAAGMRAVFYGPERDALPASPAVWPLAHMDGLLGLLDQMSEVSA